MQSSPSNLGSQDIVCDKTGRQSEPIWEHVAEAAQNNMRKFLEKLLNVVEPVSSRVRGMGRLADRKDC